MTQPGTGPGLPPPPPYPWAPPPSSPPPPPRTVTGRLVAFVCAGLALAVAAGYGLGTAGHHTAVTAAPVASPTHIQPPATAPTPAPADPQITANSPLLSTSGTVFLSDDFHDPTSGWDTGSDKEVTTRYAHPGFQTTIRSGWFEIIPSPYDSAVAQLGQTVRARLSKGFGSESALGLSCERDFGKSNDLAYQFIVDSTGTWSVYRLNKANLPSSNPHLLARGQTTAAGIKAITLGVDCITLSDHRTNRLVLFVNGAKAADLTNVTPPAADGWDGEMFNAGDDDATTVVTASLYTESTLNTNAIVGTAA